jgi:glycosyltransferase involved in cell wall biosynthesis
MASGLPVVATATEGAREIIEINDTGLVVPVGDTEALARAVISLIKNPTARERLSTQARQAARERFSLENMVTATEQAYREAFNEKPC